MKIARQLVWIAPLGLLIAGCASPSHEGPAVAASPNEYSAPSPVAEWRYEYQLPPTWGEPTPMTPTQTRANPTTRVYAQTVSYPAYPANSRVVVDSRAEGDKALADSIRDRLEYDRGLAPSFQRTTVIVRDGMVTLRGSVKSEMDGRLVVDTIRDIPGVSGIKNELAINPNWN